MNSRVDRSRPLPPTKLSILRNHMDRGEWPAAIRLAATFGSLGAEKSQILKAREAIARPDFQRSLGRDPESLIADGVAALRRRYG